MNARVITVVMAVLLVFGAAGTAAPQSLPPLPKEQPGWIQYTTLSTNPERPKLKLLGAKVYRRADGKVGVTVALKNIGTVPCKRCWLLLSLYTEPGRPPHRSWILVKSALRPPAEPGSSWRISRRCEDTRFSITSWQLEFASYAGPKDP